MINKGGVFIKTRLYIQNRIQSIAPNLNMKEFLVSNAFKGFLTKLARSLTKRRDIKVEFSKKVATDNQTIYMNPVGSMKHVKDMVLAVICQIGDMCHEICHILYTRWEVLEQIKRDFPSEPDYSRIYKLNNLVEDSAIERQARKKYTGLFSFSIRVSNTVITKHMKPLDKRTEAIDILITAAMMYAIARNVKGEIKDKELQKVFERMKPILDQGRNSNDSYDRYQAAKDLYQLLLPYYKLNNNGEEYPKNNLVGSCGKGNSPSEYQDSGDSGDGVEEATTGPKEKWQDVFNTSFEGFVKKYQKEQQQSESMKAEQTKIKAAYQNSKFEGHLHIRSEMIKSWDHMCVSQDSIDIRILCHNFVKAIKDILRYNKDQKIYGLSDGKFDSKHIYRVETDRKVFYKTQYRSQQADLAVMLIIDMSGSMGGDRIEEARKAALLLYDACKALNIPISIIGHQAIGNSNIVHHHHFIDFESGPEARKNIFNMYATGGTREGFSIRHLAKIFSMRKQKDKIMICISDGCPCHNSLVDRYSDKIAQQDSKEAVKYAEALGIKVFGVAIGNGKSEIKEIYKRFIDVQRIEHLPHVLAKLIKKEVLK